MIGFERDAYDAVVDHAIEGVPEEVCGVLGGEHGEARSGAVAVRRAENVSPTPETAYALDPEEQLALMDELEADGHEVVGFYHSHPAGPPGPSATDAAQATWPGYSYVLVALDGAHPYVGSWRWNGEAERFQREAVALE